MVSALVDCVDRNCWNAGLLADPAPTLDQSADRVGRRPVVGTVSSCCTECLQSEPAAGRFTRSAQRLNNSLEEPDEGLMGRRP